MKPFLAKYALLAVTAAPVHARFLSSGWNKHSDESTTLHDLQEKDMSPESRIVGGVLASEKEFPWYVASSTDFGYLCGGSLIHEDLVLTAAHCTEAFALGQDVFVGALHLNSAKGGAQRRTITQVLPHPDYDDLFGWNDFMLLKLNAPVKDADVLQLELSTEDPPSTEVLTTMGFGTTEEDGEVSLALREVDILPVDFDTCQSQYEDFLLLSEEVQVCAGFPGGGKDSCQGDSGGPLITSAGKQLGVISLGYGCARAGYPGIYARVSGAADFILQGICSLSNNSPSDCQEENIIEEAPPTADIRITVGYDFWVGETSWQITQGSTTIYEGPQYNPESYEVWNTTLPDVAAGAYTFTIFDSACDGLDSLYGDGFYEVWLVTESGVEQLLASGDHIFSCSDSVSFVVPGGEDTAAIEPDKTIPRARSAVVGTDKHDNPKLEEEVMHELGKHRNGLATTDNSDYDEKINEALYKRYHR